jgi:hypothetical protein
VLAAAGRLVLLGEHPERRLVVADEHALLLPARERRAASAVRVVALGQVDLDDVVRRPRHQRVAHRLVDHVVRRGDDIAERDVRRVVQRGEGPDLRHGGGG